MNTTPAITTKNARGLVTNTGSKVHDPNGLGGTLCGAGERAGVYVYDRFPDCKACAAKKAARNAIKSLMARHP